MKFSVLFFFFLIIITMKSESPIKVVCFDCGGVIANDIPNGMFKDLSMRYPEQDRERISNSFQTKYLSYIQLYELILLTEYFYHSKDLFDRFKVDRSYTEQEYWKDMIKRENLNESVEELAKLTRDSIKLYDHTYNVIKDLHKKGYIIAIMSNHSIEWFSAISEKLNLKEYIPEKYTIVSAAVGHAKPEKEIMEALMECFHPLEIQPQEIVYFDDKQRNVDSANEFGLKAHLYDASIMTEEDLRACLLNHSIE